MSAREVRAPDCPVDRTVNGSPCDGPGGYYCDSDLWGSACRRYFERIKAGDETPAETLARQFHEAYERLAPEFGYRTREASAKPWADVPMRNKRLMVAVAQELIGRGYVTARTPRAGVKRWPTPGTGAHART